MPSRWPGEAIGYGGRVLGAAAPDSPAAFGWLAVGGIVAGAVGGLTLARRMQSANDRAQALRHEAAQVPALTEQASAWQAQQRQLRHDIRGALSPALLTADRLLANDDPGVKRSGDIVVRSVEKAIGLLADTPANAGAEREDADLR